MVLSLIFVFSSTLQTSIWLTLCLVKVSNIFHVDHWCIGFFQETQTFNWNVFFFGWMCQMEWHVQRVERGEKKTCNDLWTCTVLAQMMDWQKTCSILSVFVHIISWGHICTDCLYDDFSAGSCFSRANADLRYIQSEMPLTLKPQSLLDFGLLL